jgi:hypothetical protein
LDETVNRECVFEDYILPGCFLSLYASHSHEVSRFLLPHPSTMMFLGSYTLKNNGVIRPWSDTSETEPKQILSALTCLPQVYCHKKEHTD